MNAPAQPATEDRTGSVLLGKLKVLRLLGQGGMGQVYEVEHLITRHRRALKIMHARYATSSESVARFIREAGVAGKLRTPHVVETYDAGQLEDGSPYVMMELLRGEALSALFETPAPIPSGRLVGIVCQMLEGLLVAHEAGIIHRDVKPDNVFVSRDERQTERVRLLDFGISKFTTDTADYAGTLTSDGAMMGTPFYMSPEQASGARTVDERSDLYSVGVILYEGLARKRPYDAVSLPALVIKIHSGEHVPLGEVAPDLPPGLADVVERAMQVDASLRYASARELLSALVPYADSTYVASLHTMKEVASAATMSAPGTAVKQSAVHTAAPPKKAEPSAPRPAWVMPTAVAAVVTALVIAAAFAVGRASGPGTGEGATAPGPTVAAPPPSAPAPPPTVAIAPPPSAPAPPPSASAVPAAPPVAPPSTAAHRPPSSRGSHVEPVTSPPPHTRSGSGILRDPTAGGAFGE
ncbi:MAG: serine/threonine-protein kinase [Sandaracinus sp.]